jgi:DNA-binding HxlR family transcriptional regulator
LILRNACFGATRFEQFQENLGISRATLAERLAMLVREGFFTREQYQPHPPRDRYVLTEKGRAFFDVVLAMWRFGDEWLFDHGAPVKLETRDGAPIVASVIDETTGAPVDCRSVRVRPVRRMT